jgi:hypothetical protein
MEDRLAPAGMNEHFLFTPVKESASLALHIHVHVSIIIAGREQVIPAEIGSRPAGDLPVHTHDSTGLIHIESPQLREFRLRDFFAVWGKSFNSREVLGHFASRAHPLTMTVNGQLSNAFGSLVLHDGDRIVIRLGGVEAARVRHGTHVRHTPSGRSVSAQSTGPFCCPPNPPVPSAHCRSDSSVLRRR